MLLTTKLFKSYTDVKINNVQGLFQIRERKHDRRGISKKQVVRTKLCGTTVLKKRIARYRKDEQRGGVE